LPFGGKVLSRSLQRVRQVVQHTFWLVCKADLVYSMSKLLSGPKIHKPTGIVGNIGLRDFAYGPAGRRLFDIGTLFGNRCAGVIGVGEG
jgi:hypothetical protein